MDEFEPDGPEPPDGYLAIPPEGIQGKETAGRLFPFCKCKEPRPDRTMSFGDDPNFVFCRGCRLPMSDGKVAERKLRYAGGRLQDA